MRALLTAALLMAAAPAAEARVDRGFAGGAGWKTIAVGAYDSMAQAVLRTRAGRILIGGEADLPGSYNQVLGFTRLHASGRADRSFGRRSRALVDPGGFSGYVVAMKELRDGKVLVAFSPYAGEPASGGVLRLLADGRLDRSYGDQGVASLPAPADDAAVVDMAVLPGGRAVLAGSLPSRARGVFTARIGPGGRDVRVTTRALYGAYAVGLVRTRPGHLVLAANRPGAKGRRPATILTRLGRNAPRRVIAGVRARDVDADRRSGVGVLLDAGRRWGVRRYGETLRPHAAPRRLPSKGGDPWAFTMARGSRAWVGLPGGSVARVRSDGRPDTRWAPRGRSRRLRTHYLLEATALADMPRGRVAVVGRASEEYDIREDYGAARMWIGRFF